jgi:hypothetical protein
MTDASAIVNGYREALGKGDFAAARQMLHDDMSFRGPIETFDRPEPYLESLKKLQSIIQRIEVRRTFADAGDVCVLYDMVTNTPAGTAFIAEWYQVRSGRIAAIRVVFDARPFAAMFAKH